MRIFRLVDMQKQLKVTFTGKAGVDNGGLCCEYLQLVMGAMVEQNHLLDGPHILGFFDIILVSGSGNVLSSLNEQKK